jgi:secretion/DNA translocation related TadE-like protein
VDDERGSVTLVAVAVIAIVVVATMGVADLGRAATSRVRAQQAADAAALAAAQTLALPDGADPAAVAADYARRNGASLVACVCAPGSDHADVTVTYVVSRFLLVPGPRTLTARARAVVDIPLVRH